MGMAAAESRQGVMRVLVDGITWRNPTQRGVQRYFFEVLSRMEPSVNVDIWVKEGIHGEVPGNCRVLEPRNGYYPRRRDLPGRIRAWAAWRRCRREFGGYDVFHSTFFTRPLVEGPAEVVTVHDMIPERFPWLCYWPGCAEHVEDKRRAMEAAKVCVTVSEASAREVKAFYPHVAAKVRVTQLGADHLVASAAQVEAGRLHEPEYALYVGDRNGYKNFAVVLEAMLHRAWPKGVDLVLVGPPFSVHEALGVRRMGLESRVRHCGVVSTAELQRAYRDAKAFVFPSLAEGFGFPLLESQSLGCPVIASDIEVFHETGGESVLYFDPRSPESLAHSMQGMMDDRVRSELVSRQPMNVRRFSWDRCAMQTLQAYRAAAGGRSDPVSGTGNGTGKR